MRSRRRKYCLYSDDGWQFFQSWLGIVLRKFDPMKLRVEADTKHVTLNPRGKGWEKIKLNPWLYQCDRVFHSRTIEATIHELMKRPVAYCRLRLDLIRIDSLYGVRSQLKLMIFSIVGRIGWKKPVTASSSSSSKKSGLLRLWFPQGIAKLWVKTSSLMSCVRHKSDNPNRARERDRLEIRQLLNNAFFDGVHHDWRLSVYALGCVVII